VRSEKSAKMTSLRVLLVADIHECQEVSSSLVAADHTVLPLNDVDEASEAISLQQFDAILLGDSISEESVSEFASKLRRLERAQQSATRTAIFCLGNEPSAEIKSVAGTCSPVDGYLSKRLDGTAFTDAVIQLAQTFPEAAMTSSDSNRDLPVFELAGFQEQVGYDPDLFSEIIDLFLLEGEEQIPAMRSALAKRDFDELGRVAHTIKGSLGSLHAPRARTRAEQLESAARSRNNERCCHFLSLLEDDIQELEQQLRIVRSTVSQQ